ncbi:MAG: glucose-6-phosphate dehydrogenase assembly protein OpcA [Pseudanabaenaceae cyanobacterium SKYGB_i_bin29]|nr:glucose-6-phosphate dehydrogenase assembly protein OpcA [Pseudanabaenaceae cyanobacterium SKYG29]MDW8421841.1 glucose-6-phosphate dehydrogenase assembly protein OpcA [Pseudanabaenaceae cyanobacterium SKYGB_i_bin29]
MSSVISLYSPKDVSFAQIDQELNKIWQAYGEHAAARASTFNLIVYEPKGDLASVQTTIDVIAAQSPCRVICLLPQPGEDEGITAQVASYCPIQRSRSNLICGEYITLRGTKAAFERVYPLLRELTLQDLPVFVWWKDSPDIGSLLFERLMQNVDRLILDSSLFSDVSRDLVLVSNLLEAGIAVADLNWRRINPWQELTAQAFDPPDRRQAVWDIDGITIDYERGNSAQALMFLGWIASRLQWQPVGRSFGGGDYNLEHIWFRGKDGIEVRAELAAIPVGNPGLVVGDLIGLRLSSSKQNSDACNIFCSESTGCMRMEAAGGAQGCRTHIVTPLTDQSADVLLVQQMQRYGREALYEESMAVTKQILELPVASGT